MAVQPFDLPTAASFRGFRTAVDAIEAFAACGGYPLLLERWRPEDSTESNLTRLLGDPFAPLASNASTLLLDLPDVTMHRTTLAAIGRGSHRIAEINSRAGQRVDRSLNILVPCGYVRRRTPIGESGRKDVTYEIEDDYLRFWFEIVDRNQQLVDSGQGPALVKSTRPLWTRHVASVFEVQARQHLQRLVAAERAPLMTVGEWWSHVGQAQVDVVGVADGRWVLAGEAKWQDRMSRSHFESFERNIAAAGARAARAELSVWVRGGLSPEVRSARPGVQVYGPEDMVT